MDAFLLAVSVVVSAAALVALELDQVRRVQSVELHFGRDVTPEAMQAVVDRFAGLHPGVRVILDVIADHSGVRHYIRSDQATIETLGASLRALVPSLRLVGADAALAPRVPFPYGRSIRLGGRLGVIRDDLPVETSGALLAAMQPLGARERVLVRWVIRSARPFTVPSNGQSNIESEERRRIRTKNAAGVVRARGVIAVRAGHPRRAAHLIARVNAVLRARSTAYGRVRTSPRFRAQLARELSKRSFLRMDRYASAELAPLLAWPISAPVLPGVHIGTSPQRMPAASIPETGLVLGTATWPGQERPIAQPLVGSLSHSLIVGPTGVGKSTLIENVILQHIQAGRGVVLVDGKGDSVSAILERIPQGREDDVIVVDCADVGPQPGIRLFADGEPELAADVVLGVLSDLFASSWGVLAERYLRAALVAVSHDPQGTLADVVYVYSDPVYRRRLVGQLSDSVARATLLGFDEMSAADRQHQLSSSFNRLSALLGRPIIRTVLGQTEPKLDFSRVLADQKIVLISVSPMRVGAPASRLLAALLIYTLFQAVQRRSAMPESKRRPFAVVVDEPKALGDLPTPLDALLEQARGLGVSVALAPQSVVQLPKPVQQAALTNIATRIPFRQHADDARLLAKDLGGVSAEELGELGQFEAVARIGLGPGSIAPPVTIKTLPVTPPTSDPVLIRRISAERYGRTLHEVDEALIRRHRVQPDSAVVGRKRRDS